MGKSVRMWQERVEGKIDRVLSKLDLVLQKEEAMSAELDTLKQEVTKSTDVQQSAIVLLNGLANKIMQLKDDPAAMTQLATSLRSKGQELADAITANTPAATDSGAGSSPQPQQQGKGKK